YRRICLIVSLRSAKHVRGQQSLAKPAGDFPGSLSRGCPIDHGRRSVIAMLGKNVAAKIAVPAVGGLITDRRQARSMRRSGPGVDGSGSLYADHLTRIFGNRYVAVGFEPLARGTVAPSIRAA